MVSAGMNGRYLGDGDVEVEAEAEDGAREEDDEDGECGVLEVGHLDLHGSELDSPSNRGVHGRRLETDGLPIS